MHNAHAQQPDLVQPQSIGNFMKQTLPVISFIEDSLKGKIIFIQYDNYVYEKKIYRALNNNLTYKIFIVTNNSACITGLDIFMQNKKKWDKVTSKKAGSGYLISEIKPLKSTNYKFELKNFAPNLQQNVIAYCFILFN